MAKSYHLGFARRCVNRLVRTLLRLGVGPPHTYVLIVRGRKSERLYSTPVRLVEEDSQRWLVAPYGEVAWVRNARAAGCVILSRGRQFDIVRITELQAQEAAPLLKKYIVQVPITRSFFDVTPQSPIEDFVLEASKHPVFRIDQLNR